MTDQVTVAEAIAAVLDAYGVRRIFGVPGGGSNLEVIDACAARGIDYILTHTETAAVLMAAATGELTGTPGVAMTGLGPGAASATNGVAYAWLDRAPLLLLTDSYRSGTHDFITHQKFDHAAVFGSITKGTGRAGPENVSKLLADLLDRALTPPVGPVHLDLSAIDAAALATATDFARRPASNTIAGDAAAARALIDDARRPAIIAGIQTRNDPAAAAALDRLAEHLACPVMTTYKAKGVYADGAARHAGLFTGAKTEAPWLADADLLILYGVDPVELVASPWPYEMPVLELAETEIRPHYTEPAASLFGPLPALAEAIEGAGQPTNWSDAPAPMALPEANGAALSPLAVVRETVAAAPETARITIDAGAHMLAPMSLWPAKRAFDVQISNGLSTMGFALPAAVAAAFEEPERPVIAFTGDGGLAMCLAELATIARHNLPITVIVFNDAALSLIDLKQQQRGFATSGVRFAPIDFAQVATGASLHASRVDDAAGLRAALEHAFAEAKPTLIDAQVDPAGYRAMFEAIRGAPVQATQT